MKHKEAVEILLRAIVFDKTWMNEEDYQEVLSEFMSKTGLTREKLSEDLETGVKNGYAIEYQIQIVKHIYKKMLGRI